MSDKDERSQREKFEEAARQAGCDTDEDAFDRAVKAVGDSGPKTQEEVKKQHAE